MAASELFDPNTVLANQHGKLTPQQQKAFVSALTSGRGGCLILIVAAVILVPIILLFGKQLAALQGAAQMIGFAIIIVVIIVAALLVNALYSIPARIRAASAQIEHKNGQVAFQHGQYTPIADGHSLQPIYGGGNLLPGSYSFYIVRGTNWLLSVEKLGDEVSSSAMPPGFDPSAINLNRVPEPYRELASAALSQRMDEMKTERRFDVNGLQAALASANGFNSQDLDYNRQGKLAPRQLARLKKERGSNLRWALVIVVVVIAFLADVAINNPAKFTPANVAVAGAFFGAIVLVLLYISYRANSDIRRGSVEMTEGMVRRFTTNGNSGRSNGTYYHYGVNQMSFEVSPSAYNALIENVGYRIYYVPTSKQLMSIEPVP